MQLLDYSYCDSLNKDTQNARVKKCAGYHRECDVKHPDLYR